MERYWFDSLFDADRATNKTADDRLYYPIEKIERYAKNEEEKETNKIDTIADVFRKQQEVNNAF